MFNWHLAKVTSHGLEPSVPSRRAWPRAKAPPPAPATHRLFRQGVCVWDDDHKPNHKHLGPAESASTIKTTCWVCASCQPRQVLVLGVERGQGQSRYCDSVGEIFLSDVSGSPYLFLSSCCYWFLSICTVSLSDIFTCGLVIIDPIRNSYSVQLDINV